MDNIQDRNNIIILAYDQGMEIGPSVFDAWSVNSDNIFELAARNPFDGIVLQKGLAEHYSKKYKINNILSYKVPPLIVKVNGKTSIDPDSELSLLNCSLDYALELGAKAIGYTLYLGSRKESEMMVEASKVQEYCRSNKLPFILWAYPKLSYAKELELDPKTISYCSRVAYEMGADLVKLKLPVFNESFSLSDKIEILSEIVMQANTTKVLFQGGKHTERSEFIENVRMLRESGASGMAIGRNIWSHPMPDELTKEIFELWREKEKR